MTDFVLQRKNMVESQVRPSDITDRRIIRAMQAMPREMFASADTRAIAYMDQELPVGTPGQGSQRRALLAPRTLGQMLQLLEIEADDRVLEVGAATGYGAAILSRIAKTVVALDDDEALVGEARSNLSRLSIENVTVVTGPLAAGWSAEAPYAAILVAGALPEVPPALLDQLQDGGRLATVICSAGLGQVTQWRRLGSTYAARRVAEAGVRPLPGFSAIPGFTF